MIKDLVRLMRPHQYYKNLMIYLPLVFGRMASDPKAVLLTTVGFVCLCMISSTYYIINDLKDVDKDRAHPEKKNRPIAGGRINKVSAIALALVLLFASLTIASFLSFEFTIFCAGLFFMGTMYTFVFKEEPFLDILGIAVNFVIRAVSGAYVIAVAWTPYVKVSQWLIFCPFFLSLFLSTGKREADRKLLGESSSKHKKVLRFYSESLTKQLMTISTTCLILVYSLYIFFSDFPRLIFTLPFAIYVIFRYLMHVEKGHKIARHPHLVVKDIRMMAGLILLGGIAFFAVYL